MSSDESTEVLSPCWRNSVIIVLILGFSILMWIAVRAYRDAPQIPEKIVRATGETVFTGSDIRAGRGGCLASGSPCA